MPPDPFATLDSRIESLTKAIEALTTRTSASFGASGGIDPNLLADAVAAGVNQAQATGARAAAFGHPLPTAAQAVQRGLPAAPMPKSHRYNFVGQGHQVIAGIAGSKLRNSAERQISGILVKSGLLGPGEHLGEEEDFGGQGRPEDYGHSVIGQDGNPTGRVVWKHEVQQVQSQIQKVHSRTGLAANALQGISAGEGIKGTLSNIAGGEGVAAEAAPYAAIAIAGAEIVKKAADFTAQTRQQLAGYQQDYGGSEGSQIGNLFRQHAFGLSEAFGIGSAQGEEIFQAASSMGLHGNQRQSAINGMLSLFYKYGMSAANSAKLLSVALQNGQRDMTNLMPTLVQAVGTVTQAARFSGVNAGMAQQSFTQLYSSAAPELSGGQGTVFATSSIAAAQASLGQAGQGIDFTGLLNYNTLAQAGAASGQTPGQMYDLFNQPGGGAQKALSEIQNTLWSRVSLSMNKYMPQIRQYVQRLQQLGVKPQDLQRGDYLQGLANEISQADDNAGGQLRQVLQNVLSSFNVNASPDQALLLVVGMAVNQVSSSLGFNLAGANSPLSPNQVTGASKDNLSQIVGQITGSGSFTVGTTKGAKITQNGDNGRTVMGTGIGLTDQTKQLFQDIGVGTSRGSYLTKNSAAAAYLQALQAHGGTGNPLLEALLKGDKNDTFSILSNGQKMNLTQMIQAWGAGRLSDDDINTAVSKNTGKLAQDLTQATSTSKASGAPQVKPKKGQATIVIDAGPRLQGLISIATNPSDTVAFAQSQAQNLPAPIPSNPAFNSGG